jgi:hypothetical protein
MNGDEWWYLNDKYHREDGPAVEYIDGDKIWFLNDIEYTQQEHKVEMRNRKLKELLV